MRLGQMAVNGIGVHHDYDVDNINQNGTVPADNKAGTKRQRPYSRTDQTDDCSAYKTGYQTPMTFEPMMPKTGIKTEGHNIKSLSNTYD